MPRRTKAGLSRDGDRARGWRGGHALNRMQGAIRTQVDPAADGILRAGRRQPWPFARRRRAWGLAAP